MNRLLSGLCGVGFLFGASMTVGCGPGLSHHGAYAKAPSVEPPSAIGTTTVTNATLPTLTAKVIKFTPPPILPYVDFDDVADEDAESNRLLEPENNNPRLQTWGMAPDDDDYGF